MYYSALKREPFNGKDIERFECKNGVAFKNNLVFNQPVFNDVDVIYSEPSWQQGYSTFKSRAKVVSDDKFSDYVAAISKIIRSYNCHKFIVCGKHFERKLPTPTDSQDIKLWGYTARLLSYECTIPASLMTNEDVIEHIGNKYSCVYDFSCGYSQKLLKKFYNKRFYLSDIQGRCIDFIRQYYNTLKTDENI